MSCKPEVGAYLFQRYPWGRLYRWAAMGAAQPHPDGEHNGYGGAPLCWWC